jgi:hypothetical protein
VEYNALNAIIKQAVLDANILLHRFIALTTVDVYLVTLTNATIVLLPIFAILVKKVTIRWGLFVKCVQTDVEDVPIVHLASNAQ